MCNVLQQLFCILVHKQCLGIILDPFLAFLRFAQTLIQIFLFSCLIVYKIEIDIKIVEKQENYFDKKIQKTHATEHFGK